MAVYVDPMMSWPKNPHWRYNESCHLIADRLDELHAFAKSIGLKRAWFQNRFNCPHYDLTAAKRRKAVSLGAIELTNAELAKRIRILRLSKP